MSRTDMETLRIPKKVTGLDANLFAHVDWAWSVERNFKYPAALSFDGPPDTLLSAIIDEIKEVSAEPTVKRVLDNLTAWACVYPSLSKTFGAMGSAAIELLAEEQPAEEPIG